MAPGQVPNVVHSAGDRSASRVLTMSPRGSRMPPAASLVEHSHGIRMLATSPTLTFGPSARPGRSVVFGNIRGNDKTPPTGAPAFR
jgi:hypothetical protein